MRFAPVLLSLLIAGTLALLNHLKDIVARNERLAQYPLFSWFDRHRVLIDISALLLIFAGVAVGVWIALSPPTKEVELTFGSGDDLALIATYKEFEHEIKEYPGDVRFKARDYFRHAERRLLEGQYADAAEGFQAANAVIPTRAGLLNYGIGLTYSSRNVQAESVLRDGLTKARQAGDKTLEGRFLNALGLLYRAVGDLDNALDNSQRALDHAKQSKDEELEAAAAANIGNILSDRGESDSAEQYQLSAQNIYDRTKDDEGLAQVYNNLGTIRQDKSDPDGALAYYRRAFDKFGPNKLGLAMTLNNEGNLFADQGAFDKSEEAYNRAMGYAEEVESIVLQGHLLNDISALYSQQGKYQEAEAKANEGLLKARGIKDRSTEGLLLVTLGNTYARRGETLKAKAEFENAYHLFRELGIATGLADAAGNLAEMCQLLGDFPSALSYNREALQQFIKIGDLQGQANTFISLGEVEMAQRAYEPAQLMFETGLDFAQKAKNPIYQGTALVGIGEALLGQGLINESAEYSQRALPFFENYPEGKASALANLGFAFERLGKMDQARQSLEEALNIYDNDLKKKGPEVEKARIALQHLVPR